MQEIRAFIAIELPQEIKVELAHLTDKLKHGHERTVKWVNAEGIHLTLKFLGNIPQGKVLDINSGVTAKRSRIYHGGGSGGVPQLQNFPQRLGLGV